MSAANITALVDANGLAAVWTIEATDVSHSVGTGGVHGFLLNQGPDTCYVNLVAGSVNADGAQRAGEVPLLAAMSIPIPRTCVSFNHKCASGKTATLVFTPVLGA